jgi:hypothetical protein
MCKHLALPPPPEPGSKYRSTDISILDPCAGEGAALATLGANLHVPVNQLYALELNPNRAERCWEHLSSFSHVLGPCSFFGTEISVKSFSLVYLNPPFDYAEGGGCREEVAFLSRAYELLCVGGVMVLVCPYQQIIGRENMVWMWDGMFEQSAVYKFPDAHRPYNEVCVFGVKRKERMDYYQASMKGSLSKSGFPSCHGEQFSIDRLPTLGELHPVKYSFQAGTYHSLSYRRHLEPMGWEEDIRTWTLPYAWPPRRFLKSSLTEDEIEQELARSPLWRLLREPAPRPLPRPPLALGRGHTSLSIVSGTLDGVVPSKPPHVARGYSIKVEYENVAMGKSEVNEETGAVTETRVMSEKSVSVVRCVEKDEFGGVKLFEFRSDAASGAGDEEDDYCDEED